MNILSHKDTYFTSRKDEITYVMRLGTTETAVFYGRAVKSPAEPLIYVKINDIVQQYLDVNMPDFRDYSNNVTQLSNGILTFKLYEVDTYTATTEGTTTIVARETLLETYNVRLGYDYTEEWDGESTVLSNPVNGHLDSRMKLFWSAYSNDSDGFEITSACPVSGSTPSTGSTPSVDSGDTIYSGETHTFVITSGDGAQFNNDANVWYVTYDTDYQSVYYVFSGATGISTGYTSGGEVSFYIPTNAASAATWTVSFYPYDGGTVLDTATATQGSDISYSFAFINTDGETLSSSSTSNLVTWTSTYPYITYMFYRNGVFVESGDTALDGKYTTFEKNLDTENTVSFSFEAYYNGVWLGTLTWEQDVADESSLPVTGYSTQYLTLEFLSGGTFGWEGTMGENTQYSLDSGNTWNYVVSGIALQAGDIMLLKGDGGYYRSRYAHIHAIPGDHTSRLLYIEGYATDLLHINQCPDFNVYGNIASLFYMDDFVGKTAGISYLFYNSKVHSARDLVVTNAPHLFSNCALLTEPPTLPAMELADAGCYSSMFSDCTSLTTAPELPATALSESCYAYMFKGCTALEHAPELPATTLAKSCYEAMFYGCTSLTKAPVLPAPLFKPACYKGMFYYATALNEITCLANDRREGNCTANWVRGVGATGTFKRIAGTNWSQTDWDNYNGSPQGWTVIDIT